MNDRAALLLNSFELFVRFAFRDDNNGQELGDDPYIAYICRLIAAAKDAGARLLLNMPPRHLKTFIGSVCFTAWLLARNPAEKIVIITYSEPLALDIAYRIRKILRSPWYKKFFRARLADDRSRIADFATTAGGGVRAVSAEGSITGFGGTVLIFDDPLAIKDAGNLAQITKINQDFDNMISSRLNNPKKGRMLIIGHRLNPADLSGHVLKCAGWDHIALPFIAVEDKDYDCGSYKWHRKAGELLRPDAFSQAEIDRIKNTLDYEALYQQFLGEGHSVCINRDHFKSFKVVPPDASVIISVDPGHRPGTGHSFTVMQAWTPVGDDFYLLDQWRAQADVNTVSHALIKGVAKSQAVAVLIEWSGYGQTLHKDCGGDSARSRFCSFH